jgi:cytochrome P450/nitrite reductase/ring-hydroxylating ferredoxin subunit
MSQSWCDAGPLPELDAGETAGVHAGGVDLVVLNSASGLRVFDGRCPHQGALLAEGEIEDGLIVCRNHRWKFDCSTGERQGGSQCLKRFEHKVEEGRLWIEVDSSAGETPVRPKKLRRPEDLPGPEGSFLMGNARDLHTDRFHRVLEDWASEFGPVYKIRIATRRIVVISDPAMIAQALRHRPDTYSRSRRLAPIFKEVGVDGVFSAEGAAWRPQRKLAVRALANRNLKSFYPVLQTMAERLKGRWARSAEAGAVIDIQSDLMRFTVDVTTMLAFGHDLNTLEKGEDVIQRHLEPIFPILTKRLQSIVPYWRLFRLPRDRQLDQSLEALRKWLSPILSKTRARLAANPELGDKPSNFLESMLSSKNEHGKPFSEAQIFGNSMTMLLAGEDTTANTLAWSVHHLLDDPNSVSELVQELDETLGADAVPASADVADGLQFASAVANETMRVRPVAPTLFADCNGPNVLGDLQLDRRTTIALLLRPPAQDDEIMPEGKKFKPKRWLDPSTEETAQRKQVYMPFGSGPRICPGRSLALLEMNLVLATLYKNFEVERVGSSPSVTEKFSFTMAPVGHRVKLKARR